MLVTQGDTSKEKGMFWSNYILIKTFYSLKNIRYRQLQSCCFAHEHLETGINHSYIL